ncbi:MAG: 2-aminoethylphosphonate--pyruvate transaminase [Campylobacterales bacterium]|nr:2-aminoethylphosphonate--pyruvate transaminase [Campylobacterales bacterium]
MQLNLPLDNPYILLTPGPLSTTRTVRAAMLKDWCTWDSEYNALVQAIRYQLCSLASTIAPDMFTAVLMQGSGTFSVESALGTLMPKNSGKILILSNGAYGERMGEICTYAGISHTLLRSKETEPITSEAVENALKQDPAFTAVAVVHCETTTGMLNPIDTIGAVVKEHGKLFMVDAMSSFGGIPLDMQDVEIDVLVSSANKCIQGVPGFGFILFRRDVLLTCKGNARSLSLDAYAQWEEMEHGGGKWRFTSPTHVVRAFKEALDELSKEGGVSARHARYDDNHRILVEGMEALGFVCVLPPALQSPIITSFYSPKSPKYEFKTFYNALKRAGFVIYPGKISAAESFRIGTIGHVFPIDMRRLLEAITHAKTW